MDPDVLGERRRRNEQTSQKEMAAMAKVAAKHQDRLRKYTALVQKGEYNKETKGTVESLRLWLQVRVKKSDGVTMQGMKRAKLEELKAEFANREPLTLEEYLIDTKPQAATLYLDSLKEQQPAESEANDEMALGGLEGVSQIVNL